MSNDRKKQIRNVAAAVGIGALITGASYGLYCYLSRQNSAQIYHQDDEEDNEEESTDPCNNEMCTICQDPMTLNCTTISACKHSFHKNCIAEWKKVNRTCPICRAEI